MFKCVSDCNYYSFIYFVFACAKLILSKMVGIRAFM